MTDQDPSNTPQVDPELAALLDQFNQRYEQKKYKSALGVLTRILELYPNMVDVLVARGRLHLILGNNPAARVDFAAAYQLAPAYLPPLVNLASLDITDRDYPAARERLLAARDLDPQNSTILTMLADTHLHLDEIGPAFELYRAFLRFDPTFSAHIIHRASEVYDSGNVPLAARMLRLILEVEPNHECRQLVEMWEPGTHRSARNQKNNKSSTMNKKMNWLFF